MLGQPFPKVNCYPVLLNQFNLSTRDPSPSVARDLAHEAVLRRPGQVGPGVVAQTQVVLLGVDHHGASDDGAELLVIEQFHLAVRHAPLGVAVRVSYDVALGPDSQEK